MSWTAVILKGPDAEPVVIDDMQEERPRDWMVWSYGDDQENRMGFFRVGICDKSETAYLLKVLQWEAGELILNTFHLGDEHVRRVLELNS